MTNSTTPDDRFVDGAIPSDGRSTDTGDDATDQTGAGQPVRKRNIFSRHKVLTALALVLLLIVGTAGGYVWWLNQQLGNIERADMGITEPEDGALPPEKDRALNILLLGADHGGAQQSVAEDLEDGQWTKFLHRSDTIMLVHIPADRDSVQLVSIPRDTWTKVEGYPADNEMTKINAAFAYGGPSLARQTVEDLTGVRVDHMAIIDWQGFRDLTTALGGVRVYVPVEFYDSTQKVTWEQGWQELEGEPALQYVRTRHDIPGDKMGDYGRIARQQNFLRATMSGLLSGDTTRNPIKLGNVIKVITSYLTVDDTWSNGEIRDLALSLRDLDSRDVDFITMPTVCCPYSADGQSTVRVKKEQAATLFEAVAEDDIAAYLEQYPEDRLAGEKAVN
jgi:LCP family protein required for cell wall assembly